MTTTSVKNAAAKESAAALAEVAPQEKPSANGTTSPEPEGKHAVFHGIDIDMPADLPTTFMFDLAEWDAQGDNPMPAFRLARSIVGADKWMEIRNKVASLDDDIGDILGELMNVLFEPYGISLGE